MKTSSNFGENLGINSRTYQKEKENNILEDKRILKYWHSIFKKYFG